ncbi:MAG: uroporphyrinogen decarboxylase family protein [Spirochaetota bacterium]
MMKPRERLVTALNCGVPDRVPVYDFLFSRKLMKELLGYTTELYDGAAQVKLASKLGLDGIFIPINGYCGFEDEVHKEGSRYTDEWGITYIKAGWPVMVQVDVPIKKREDWKNYRLPDPAAPHRTSMIRDAVRANAEELAIIVGFLGPFTMMYWYFMDLATLSLTIFDDPSLIVEMCDAYTRWVLECAKIVQREGGIDAFMVADDWGGTTSLLMSPKHLREFFIRPFGEIVQGLKKYGFPVAMHNDGNIWAVLDDLVATGINGYHPIERAASMDLGEVKRRYSGKLCPIGNINNKTTMVSGTPEDVEREAMECLRVAAPGGGYIMATDHSLHDDIPIENIQAYIETTKRYGTYPLKF